MHDTCFRTTGRWARHDALPFPPAAAKTVLVETPGGRVGGRAGHDRTDHRGDRQPVALLG
ncbi:hypothetical protein SBRY_20754 [Actinacidiphila bryophytorum]|uniref:Uncharacterized protein n=1 Tax=Actinacidiphila bryophytorum TaxID=1436133 RepID=A0A9W4EA49_9ACTN|nr:hypothetical protein SBRY_20754 [Actinacidiphila bryophytorum]